MKNEKLYFGKLESVLLGFSGLLIYFAFDESFSMQVITPIIILLLFTMLFKSNWKLVVSNKVIFLIFIILIYCTTLFINMLFDNKIINFHSIIRLVYICVIFLYYYLIIIREYDINAVKTILYGNVTSGLFIALLIIKNWFNGAQGKISLISFFGKPVEENYTGSLLAFIAVLTLLIIRFNNKNRKLFIVSETIMAFAILLTGSRSAFLAYIMGFSLCLFQYFFGRGKIELKKIFIIVIIFIVLSVILYNIDKLLPEFIYNRLFVNGFGDKSNNERINIWTIAINGFFSRPLLGYGVGNFNYYILKEFPKHANVIAHNSFLDILLDIGLIGFIIVMSFLFWNIKDIMKKMSYCFPLIIVLGFTAFIVGGEKTFFFWNGIALLTILSKCSNKGMTLESIFRGNYNEEEKINS